MVIMTSTLTCMFSTDSKNDYNDVDINLYMFSTHRENNCINLGINLCIFSTDRLKPHFKM